MKKKYKAALVVLAIVAVGVCSSKAYDSYKYDNIAKSDLLLAENALALSDTPDTSPNTDKTSDGSWVDSPIEVAYCTKCHLEIGYGKCLLGFGCSYTEKRLEPAHYYDCTAGNRLTDWECRAIMNAYPHHRKSSCSHSF